MKLQAVSNFRSISELKFLITCFNRCVNKIRVPTVANHCHLPYNR